MGFFDRITAKAAPYDDEYDYVEDEYGEPEAEEYYEEAEITPIRAIDGTPDVARIVTAWVSSYREVADFATEFRNGLPVILNLSKSADAERARIVDFAVGLCFGLEGTFSRISDDVFLLTPHEVKIDSHGADNAHDFS